MEKPFFGGLPTGPDVRKLREAFPVAAFAAFDTGVVPYGAVEAVIRESRISRRFGGVTKAWRRIVEHEEGVVIGVVNGVGFKVLSDEEKVCVSSSKLKTAKHFARRSFEVAALVDVTKIGDDRRADLLSIQNRAAAVMLAARIKNRAPIPESI